MVACHKSNKIRKKYNRKNLILYHLKDYLKLIRINLNYCFITNEYDLIFTELFFLLHITKWKFTFRVLQRCEVVRRGPNSTNHLCMRTTNFLMDEDELENEHERSE